MAWAYQRVLGMRGTNSYTYTLISLRFRASLTTLATGGIHVGVGTVCRLLVAVVEVEVDRGGEGVWVVIPVLVDPLDGALDVPGHQFQGDEGGPGPPGVAPRRYLRPRQHFLHRLVRPSSVGLHQSGRGRPSWPLLPSISWTTNMLAHLNPETSRFSVFLSQSRDASTT